MKQSSSSTTEPQKKLAPAHPTEILRPEEVQDSSMQKTSTILYGVDESEKQKLALTDEICALVVDNLPISCKGSSLNSVLKWYLLYSSNIHGKSFQSLVKHIACKGPTVLIVKLKNCPLIIGAFCESDWLTVSDREKAAKSAAAASTRALREGQVCCGKIAPKKQNGVFFGSDSCFLFRARSDKSDDISEAGKVYRSKPSMNANFMYLFDSHPLEDKIGIGMGGQPGYYGWFIDRWLENGTCYGTRCTTFDCPRLTPTERWLVDSVEVYAVKSDVVEQLIRDGNQYSIGLSCMNGNPDCSVDQLLLEMSGMHQFNVNERPDC